MLVEHSHIRLDTRLIFHSIRVSIHMLQNNFLTLVNDQMVLINIKHLVVTSTRKKEIIGILNLLLHAKDNLFK